MSYQPRIRTLKPESWSDEAVVSLSRDARLFRVVLITYADDDGRWRHRPSALIGFGYPEDDDVTPAKIKRWTTELVGAGLVIIYQHDGREYGCFPTWHLHQQINKYRPSALPGCPDERVIGLEEAKTRKGKIPSSSGRSTGPATGDVREDSHPHAQALGSGSGSSSRSQIVEDARASIDEDKVRETVAILKTCPRLQFDLELMGVANALAAHPALDHKKAAHLTVTNASDPSYRTTDAGRALTYAFAQLERRGGQVTAIRDATEKRLSNTGDFSRFDQPEKGAA